MTRYSRSLRRSLPGFGFDMAMRDMRRAPWSEMTAEQRRAWAQEQARKAIEKMSARREGRR